MRSFSKLKQIRHHNSFSKQRALRTVNLRLLYSRKNISRRILDTLTLDKLLQARRLSTRKLGEDSLLDEIHARIEVRGPITVAEYMSLALGHPLYGYYQQRDVFGSSGDFITSPEISQVFGELIGIWCVAQWSTLGKPEKLRLVELGPGRGTLMSDLLRACRKFPDFIHALSAGGGIQMIETSHALASIQAKSLNCHYEFESKKRNDDRARKTAQIEKKPPLHVEWLERFQQVDEHREPGIPLLVIAQELFDALPIHQFELSQEGTWCERLVDVQDLEHESYSLSERSKEQQHLRFVLSPGPTPASKLLIQSQVHPETLKQPEDPCFQTPGTRVEVSAVAAALIQDIVRRLITSSGSCLIIDYGENGASGDSLRGIKNHEFVNPLHDPGKVDLSADVDFSLLTRMALNEGFENVKIDGPITQGEFLRNLGIEYRVAALLQNIKDEEMQLKVFESFQRLVEGEDIVEGGMGKSYKALGITCNNHDNQTPTAGFRALD